MPETLPNSDAIDEAVIAWHQGDGEPVAGLGEADRREALRRLGYDRPSHLAMFGLR